MERNDFHSVNVVAFFFVSAASRKSYLVQLGMRKQGCAMQGGGRGRKGGGGKRLAFYANDEGRAVAAVVQETAAKWQITRVYPQPPFLRGAHSTPGIKRHWAASSKAPGISRPSIHHKPAATMLTTSFRHVVVEDLSRPKLKITLSSLPKSLWSIHDVWLPSTAPLTDDRFPLGKKIAVSVCSGFIFHWKILKGANLHWWNVVCFIKK